MCSQSVISCNAGCGSAVNNRAVSELNDEGGGAPCDNHGDRQNVKKLNKLQGMRLATNQL